MRTIKLYITCSDELELDKNIIENLIRQLNSVNYTNGLKIELLDCDDCDLTDAIQSDMFVALFHRNADKLSFEGVKKASESYKERKTPKVFIYFKDMNPDENPDTDLAVFKEHLCNVLGHFVNRYSNSDSIRFSILMQVMQIEGVEKAKVEVSKVVIGNEVIADLKNIPFAENNDSYQELLNTIASLDKEIKQLQGVMLASPNDIILGIVQQKKVERERLLKKLESKGEDLINTATTIASMSCEISSQRLRTAIDYFEQGENEKAKALLNPKIISDELAHNISIADKYTEAAINNINELRLRIKLEINEKACGWLSSCISNYETIIRFTEANPQFEDIYIDTMSQYIFFLTQNNQISKITGNFESFLHKFRSLAITHPKYSARFANFLVNYAWYYYKTYRYEKAEALYSEARAVYDGMEWRSSDAKSGKHADITSKLATVYLYQNQIKKADKAFKQAIASYAELTKIDGAYFKGLYETILNHTKVLIKQRNYAKVIEACTLVDGVFRKWANEHIHFKVQHAYTLSQLGLANYGLKNYEKSIDNYSESVSLYRQLSEKSPEAYNLSLAYNLSRLGDVCVIVRKADQANAAYKEAIDIYDSAANYAGGSFEAHYSYLLTKLASLSNEDNEKNPSITIEQYRKAASLYREIAKKDQQYQNYLAWTLDRLGNVLMKQKDYEHALECYAESLSLYKLLNEASPELYIQNIAWALTKTAQIHIERTEFKEALLDYSDSLSLYKKLADNESELYSPSVAWNLSKLGDTHYDLEEFVSAKDEYTESVALYRKLVNTSPGRYEKNLAEDLGSLANTYYNLNMFSQALPICIESKELYVRLYTESPEEYRESYIFTLHNLACTYSSLHDIKACIPVINKAIEVSGNDLFYVNAKGDFYIENDDLQNAIDIYQQIIATDRDYFSYHNDTELFEALKKEGIIN